MLRTRWNQTVLFESTRPSYMTAPSMCWRLQGFYAVDEFPIRSPLAVADFLAPRVAGRSFCEIGTRNGDIMACLAHFAERTTAVEMDRAYCEKLKERGLGVMCKPVEEATDTELEAMGCDVYFWWPMSAFHQNPHWLELLRSAHRRIGRPATVFVAHDTQWNEDMDTLPDFVDKNHGTIHRIYFDEGGSVNRTKADEASYREPFFGRRGMWGVFHLAEFELGKRAGRGGARSPVGEKHAGGARPLVADKHSHRRQATG